MTDAERDLKIVEWSEQTGRSSFSAPRVWNVAEDDAADALEAVAAGSVSWGTLFWVPLMAGADDAIAQRWKEVVTNGVDNRSTRGNLAVVALVFAELAGRAMIWKRALEDFDMTESQVVNEWISKGELRKERQLLLRLLNKRFPGAVPPEVAKLISEQESLDLLNHWFDAAASAVTYDEFFAVLKR